MILLYNYFVSSDSIIFIGLFIINFHNLYLNQSLFIYCRRFIVTLNPLFVDVNYIKIASS